jgi:hypothetical protein
MTNLRLCGKGFCVRRLLSVLALLVPLVFTDDRNEFQLPGPRWMRIAYGLLTILNF